MAERRMFSKAITGSARFLRMPPTSRLLYYDLGMSADDDGVTEAFSVMRTTGATEDDLKVLASKNYIKVLNEDLVTFIVDWHTNNQLRKDRYHPGVYHQLLVQLNADNQIATSWQPDDNQMATEVSKEKGRQAKGNIDNGRKRTDKPSTHPHFKPPTLDEVTAYVRERGSNVDPQGFIDFYAAKGWVIGKSPMKDWRAACRSAENWERWRKTPPSRQTIKTDADYQGGDFFEEGYQ